jgi:hypothetical protein
MVSRIAYVGAMAALTLWACEPEAENGSVGPTSSPSATSSGAGGSHSGGSGGMEPMCPHMGPDVIDPTTLPPCPTTICAGGGRCLPTALIPPEYHSQLTDCDAENKCLPDEFIKTRGYFIAQTCTGIVGNEGRCMSECLPEISARAAFMPVDICPPHHRCAPCFDPVTGGESGVCSLTCDPGPTTDPVVLPGCCNGLGTCVPKAFFPTALGDRLPADSCPVDTNDYVCAPTQTIADPIAMPQACLTEVGGEPGACLPACLAAGFSSGTLGQSTCATDYLCAPCLDTGNPTGACDL